MPTISQKDYETMQRMIAEDPNISFGARDPRNPDVTVGSKPSTPPASSGGGGSKTPSNSGSRVSPPSSKSDGVMPSSSRGGGSSSNTRSIDPNLVTGYDPNWFSSLSPEIQQKAQAERQRSGYAALPTDRPLAWEESVPSGAFPSSFENLPERIQGIVGGAEQAAFKQWIQQQQPVIPPPPPPPPPQGITKEELMAILSGLQQPLNQYNYLYEQLQRDLLAQMPKAPQLTPEQMLAQAQQYANIHVDPQVQALQRALEQYQANAEAQQRAIEAAYATIPQQTQQMLDEARQAALESAIARGAGRSGVVDWQTQKLSAPIMTAAQQAEAQRAASLTNVADQLALQQQQAQTQLQQLEKMRGDLTQQYMQQLQDQGYIRSVEDWQNAWSAASQMAEMAMSANQANMQTGIGLLNAIALGQMPWPDLNAGTSSGTTAATSTVSGAVAPLTGGGNDLVPVRGYVEGWGGSVSYDPTTGEVIVNGRRFKPSDVGGYIQNGVAYAPRSYLTQLLGG